ncbi:MAG: GNAT family N-acetyltransferase [Deltaproteobacteria bacterium]|nr:GNAT family N-acetyltransferase [Deltaproteobacteria bacterium]
MSPTPKKVHRRRCGELTVEQAHDTALIAAMLDTADMGVSGPDQSARCFLIAYSGDEPVGIAGLETDVDAALMGPFFVVSEMRRQGVGARLISALRLAALSRGARTLYAAVPVTFVDYFARLGFAEINTAEVFRACRDCSLLQQIRGDNRLACRALRADLSWESVVER